MCNLYSQTRAVDAMRRVFAAQRLDTGGANLEPLAGIYPDMRAPVIVQAGTGLAIQTARWGMPTPATYLVGKRTDRGVTNIRNPASPYWRRWLVPAHRCLVPFDRFAEPAMGGGNVWFEVSQGTGFFAGILLRDWTSTRKLADGPTTDTLFAFLTTDANPTVAAHHPKAMPVILTEPDEWDRWLTAPWGEAALLQRPLAEGMLRVAPPTVA